MTFKQYKNKETGEIVLAQLMTSGDWCDWYAIRKNLYTVGNSIFGKEGDQMLYNSFHEKYEPVL